MLRSSFKKYHLTAELPCFHLVTLLQNLFLQNLNLQVDKKLKIFTIVSCANKLSCPIAFLKILTKLSYAIKLSCPITSFASIETSHSILFMNLSCPITSFVTIETSHSILFINLILWEYRLCSKRKKKILCNNEIQYI